MLMRRVCIAAGLAAWGTLCTAQGERVLLHETFGADGNGAGGGYVTVSDLTNWTVTGGNIDILNGGAPWGCADTCLDLDGSGSKGAITLQGKQALHLVAGQTIEARFEIIGGTEREPFLVGFTNGSATYGTEGFEGYNAPLSAAARMTAKTDMVIHPFIELSKTPDSYGPYLDSVMIVDVTRVASNP